MSAVNAIHKQGTPLVMLGKYELVGRMAAGGMAAVHLARLRGPMNFQKVVVVKTIHPHLASQEEFLRMLLDEARLAALIKHPRVVDIYDLGKEGSTYFIAMEFLDGQPLTKVVAHGMAGDRLDPLSCARVIADAAAGLHAAHELKTMSGKLLGLVHRDVSPGNIMVLYDNSAKIVDFGIAKARGRLTISGVDEFKGKLGYVAPEQLTGEAVDRRTDVFSLGVVLWEALTLKRLFPRDNQRSPLAPLRETPPAPPSQIASEVPSQLDAVCLKALAPKPRHRFQTAGELKEALEEALRELGYFRESNAIRSYMERVFAEQRARYQTALRAATTRADSNASDFAEEPSTATGMQRVSTAPGGATDMEVEPLDDDAFADDSVADDTVADEDPDATEDIYADEGTETGDPVKRSRLRREIIAAVVLAACVPLILLLVDRLSSPDPRGATDVDQLTTTESSAAASPSTLSPELDSEPAPPAGEFPGAATDEDESEDESEDGEDGSDGPDAGREGASVDDEDGGEDRQREDGALEDESEDRDDAERSTERRSRRTAAESRSARKLHEDGSKQFLLGNHKAARKLFKQALDVDSRHAPAHRGLGLVYQAEGRVQKAKRHFKKYLRLRPKADDARAIRQRLKKLEEK